MTSRGKNSVQKESPSSAYDSRRPDKVDLNIEALPLLTDGGERSVFSEYDESNGSSYDLERFSWKRLVGWSGRGQAQRSRKT
jgi:hypothetical protein